MPAWNDGNFFTLLCLDSHQKQLEFFYDGYTPPKDLPLEIQTLDAEIAIFALQAQQRRTWVYSASSWPTVERFQRRTLCLAQPLLERRRRACEVFNQADKLLTLFPPEVIDRIFEFAVIDANTVNPLPCRLPATLHLASVARAWRSLVIRNPNLWTSFKIPVSYQYEDMLPTLDIFLSRSGDIGLYIQLDIEDVWADHMHRVVDIIRCLAPRIRIFRVVFPRYTQGASDQLALFDFPFPTANSVSIHSTNVLGHSLCMPSVTHLQIHSNGLQSFHHNFSSLASLDVSDVSLYQLWNVLEASPMLNTLKATVILGGELAVTTDTRLILGTDTIKPRVHMGLRTLVIDHGDVLCMLTLPSLTSLSVWCPHHSLAPFIDRSHCTLLCIGLDAIVGLDSLMILPTVQQLVVKVRSSNDYIDFCDDISRRMDFLQHIHCIALHVDTTEIWNPPIILELARFIVSSGEISHLDATIPLSSHFSDLEDLAIPKHRYIRVNGHYLAHYQPEPVGDKAKKGKSLRGDMGREQLDCLDGAIMVYAQVQSTLRSATNAVGMCFRPTPPNWHETWPQ